MKIFILKIDYLMKYNLGCDGNIEYNWLWKPAVNRKKMTITIRLPRLYVKNERKYHQH